MPKLTPKITLLHLYPDQLNLYGDRGNVECLVYRAQKRQLAVEVIPWGRGEYRRLSAAKVDLVFMGGGPDAQQKEIFADFLNVKGPWLKDYHAAGGVGLFICGAYQLLGNYYQPYSGPPLKGLGLADFYTEHFGRDRPRCVGNVVVRTLALPGLAASDSADYLVGFENHGGQTYLGEGVSPLGRVVRGWGNNGQDRTEGVAVGNFFGTYLHGPLLPRNPHLADGLLSLALARKRRVGIAAIKLTPLDDREEWLAHRQGRRLRR